VEKIEKPYKEIGDTEKEKALVIEEFPRVPCEYKDAAGNHNTEHLGKAVKEEKAVKVNQIKQGQTDKENGYFFVYLENKELFLHCF